MVNTIQAGKLTKNTRCLVWVTMLTFTLVVWKSIAADAPAVQLVDDAKYDLALKALQEKTPAAEASVPDRVRYLLSLAHAQSDVRQYDKSIENLREVLKSYSTWDYPHIILSVYLGKAGQYKEAEAEALRAIELNGKSTYAKLVLASWQWHLGKKEDALATVKVADAVPDGSSEMRMVQGCLSCFYASVGDEKKIEEHIEQSIKLDPNRTDFFKRDPCFDPYRAKPWFIKLVGKTLKE